MNITCPKCDDTTLLSLAQWEDFTGSLVPGKTTRIGLVCTKCHTRFFIQVTLTQVIERHKVSPPSQGHKLSHPSASHEGAQP